MLPTPLLPWFTQLRPVWFVVLLASAQSASAGTYEARNIEANDLLTGIYSITVAQAGMTPVIRVQSDGEKFTSVEPGQTIIWKANTRGVCRSLRKIREYRWWLNDNAQANPNSYYSKHAPLTTKNWITSKHSDDKYTADGELSVPVNNKLANAAVAACNDYLQAEKSQGKSIQDILGQDKTLYSEENDKPLLAGVVYMQCNEDSGMNTMLGHAWQNVRINYLCEASETPKPGAGSSAKTQKIALPFMLEEPKIKLTPAHHSGTCPVDVQVEGTLKANQGQKDVQYRWVHNGAAGPAQTVVLNTSGWRTVNTILNNMGIETSAGNPSKTLAAKVPKSPGAGLQIKALPDNVHTGYVELKVLPAGDSNWDMAKTSVKARYQITCKTPVVNGADKLLPPGKPKPPQQMSDLSYASTIMIGNAVGQWGGSINVNAAAIPGAMRADRCALRVAYDVTNLGAGDAGGFVSRLFENDDTLLQSGLPQLEASQHKKLSGLIYLNNGTHLVGLSVDDQIQVSETSESNNKARITVHVSHCGEAESAGDKRGNTDGAGNGHGSGHANREGNTPRSGQMLPPRQ